MYIPSTNLPAFKLQLFFFGDVAVSRAFSSLLLLIHGMDDEKPLKDLDLDELSTWLMDRDIPYEYCKVLTGIKMI